MLRWRQSTRHILDAYGRKATTNLYYRQHSVSAPGRPIAQTLRNAAYAYSTGTLKKDSAHPYSDCGDSTSDGDVSRKTTRPRLQTVPPSSKGHGSSRPTVLPPMSKGLNASKSSARPFDSSNTPTKSATNTWQSSADTPGGRSNDGSAPEAARALEDILYCSFPKERSISLLLHEYRKLSTQSLLHQISRPVFTDLVAICGGLCLSLVYSPQNPKQGILDSLFGQRAPSAANLGNFVADVIHDMNKLGFTGPRDSFWLRQVKAALDATGNHHLKSRQQALLCAIRSQYQPHMDDPTMVESHVAYISFLLSTSRRECVEEAAKFYTLLLESTSEPCVRHAEIFWQLVSPRNTNLSDAIRDRLCVVALRLMQRPATRTLSTPDGARGSGVSAITLALAATLFPGLDNRRPMDPLRPWATSLALQALSPTLTLDTRWQNLTLLSLAMSTAGVPISYRGRPNAASCSVMWRTTLMLDALSRMLGAPERVISETPPNVQTICRNLWELFTTAPVSNQPREVNRACASAFLRLAATTRDEELFIRCSNFCRDLRLWTFSASSSASVRRQALDVLIAFSAALKTWKRLNWQGLFGILEQNFDDDVPWQGTVSDALIQHYAQHDVDAAFDLYLFCRKSGIKLRDQSHVPLALALVSAERWDRVPEFLNVLFFKPQDVETVVVALMCHYQQHRREHADPDLMNILSHRVPKLYEDFPPPSHLKYPIRYFLSMLIWSGHSASALRLIQSLKKSTNNFFSTHLLRRLVSQLVSKRQYSDALKLYDMFKGVPDLKHVRSMLHIRRKLTSKFATSGSYGLFRKLPKRRSKRVALRRECLVRISVHRRHTKTLLYFAQIRPLVGATSDGPTIRDAVTLLVKHGRIYAARKLYAKYRVGIDVKTCTAIGNIILHGPITGSKLRNGRLVRNILRMKDRLIADCGFVPDRATTNILLKAMLRWKSMFDARRVRQLFDTMIREGYPVPDHWRRQPHNVPFNTLTPRTEGFGIPVSATINFNRHTRPMYKMFIKAFYLRKDVAAAKTVVGILKEVQAEVVAEREKRNRARREGIIKKKLREEKASQGRLPDLDSSAFIE
ncbi:hypothetical protein D9619_004474 [Psilocybe cf. subviscida]|uniref:Uncharacterized protein n=1 Tax=Psilocybe cf. subviscida TaxID=2480587 RepID=A0A8H5BR28_9AGAR|nr:hypothetical protein D9619_004474 [Psilocybe cf. subviscida]